MVYIGCLFILTLSNIFDTNHQHQWIWHEIRGTAMHHYPPRPLPRIGIGTTATATSLLCLALPLSPSPTVAPSPATRVIIVFLVLVARHFKLS